MLSHKLYITSNIMESKECVKKIIGFCGSFCTKITFGTYWDNYNLSIDEYRKACSDFFTYYRDEDEKRRNEFVSNLDYKRKLLNTYQTEKEVSDYFDRLYQYDLIQFDELKNDLKRYMNSSTKNKILSEKSQDKNILPNKGLALPKEAYQGNKFTFISHSTIGGIYKVYDFKLISPMIETLMNVEDLFKSYVFDDMNKLEDPAFYLNNDLILSISTHERTTTLFLSDEQYNAFRQLEVPYNLG